MGSGCLQMLLVNALCDFRDDSVLKHSVCGCRIVSTMLCVAALQFFSVVCNTVGICAVQNIHAQIVVLFIAGLICLLWCA